VSVPHNLGVIDRGISSVQVAEAEGSEVGIDGSEIETISSGVVIRTIHEGVITPSAGEPASQIFRSLTLRAPAECAQRASYLRTQRPTH
jgi:hypothetical protein